MNPGGSPSRFLVIVALVAVQVLFGVNYVTSKIVLAAIPPLIWATIRVIVTAAVMIAVALLMRRPRPSGRTFFVPLVGFALLGIVINQGLFLIGLKYTTVANSAVLNTLVPVMTLMIVAMRGQERVAPRQPFGFFCAFIGVLVLLRVERFSLSSETTLGDLLTVLNCTSYAFFLVYSKSFLEAHDRVWTTAWLFAYGSIAFAVISAPLWPEFRLPAMTPLLLGCIAFAIVGGTIITYFLNVWALAHARSSSVALFMYLQPVVASTLAWVWLGQPISPRSGVATLLIFAGMVLALSARGPTVIGSARSP
jgi:drug/metabolite transporter (DMT)-like permease